MELGGQKGIFCAVFYQRLYTRSAAVGRGAWGLDFDVR